MPGKDQSDLMRLDLAVHQLIYRAAGNSHMEEILIRYANLWTRIQGLMLERRPLILQHIVEFDGVIQAILGKDEAKAAALMAGHVSGFSSFTRFHKKLVAACMGGPILDGYILSIIAIALVGISADFHTTELETSLIGASALVGIFFGAVLLGPLTDRIGRRLMYTIDLWALVIVSVLQFFVQDSLQLIILRFIAGLTIGADYQIANSLLAEWLPRKRRGQMLGVLQVGWFIGAALASLVGFAIFEAFGAGSWRWILLTAAVLGTVVMLMRLGTPESPRWLLHNGRKADAKLALRAALSDQLNVDHVVFETADEDPVAKKKVDLRVLLRRPYLKRITFCSSFYALQVGPLFAIFTFGPTILSAFGMGEGNLFNLGSVIIDMVFLAGCIPALKLIESWGRRPLIVCASP